MTPIAHLCLQTVVKRELSALMTILPQLGLLHFERVESNFAYLGLQLHVAVGSDKSSVEVRFVLHLKRDTNCSSQAADSCRGENSRPGRGRH